MSPPFERQGDVSFRLFENPLERCFGLFLVDPAFSLTRL
jgi:hypothetical protein